MRYLSVCSGIEAATVAWEPLGWQAVAYSEIEKFPSAVLNHRYPNTPNWGDMTKYKEWPDAKFSLLVGGTPCQSFSVAGLRKGMADPRGNLALDYLGIADRYGPDWVVWENVPGVLSSNDGRDFGAFLGALGKLRYGWAYRVLDAQYFGVAQRRRRVFVVGHLGDWRPAHAVLCEQESLCGHPAPRRETGPGTSTGFEVGPGAGGFTDLSPTLDARCKDGPIINQLGVGVAAFGGNNTQGPIYVATALNACGTAAASATQQDAESGALIEVPFDTTQITSANNFSNPKPGDPCHPLAAGAHAPAIAFSAKDHGADATEDLSPTLRAGGADRSHANSGNWMAVAVSLRGRDGGATAGLGGEVCPAIRTGGGGDKPHVLYSIMPQNSGKDYKAKECEVAQPLMTAPTGGNQGGDYLMTPEMAVRRLTPRECERLQGFPDGYTLIPYRGKDPQDCPDGPRYKALGNSMAVPVMRWIGERIQLVANIKKGRKHNDDKHVDA